MSASPGLHLFPENAFEHAVRRGVRIAVRRLDGERPRSWLADLGCLPSWLLVGHAAHHEVERCCGRALALFERHALLDGLWLVRVGQARYLLGVEPDSAWSWTSAPALATAVPVTLPTESAQFALGGTVAEEILRELCTFDPMPLAQPGSYVPLLIAQHEAVLLREADGFILRAAAADAHSLGSALAAALIARGGALIGYDDYQRPRSGAPS